MLDVSKCKITRFPDPVLAEPAKPIDQVNDEIRQLAEKMIDIMIETKGVGLAGPQAGVNLRIFVISPDGTRESAKVYINPTIDPTGNCDAHDEGCLSLPGVTAKIRRYKECSVTATDLEGNSFTEQGHDLLARIFQHEFDHLQGRLIKDRMSQVAKFGVRKRLKQMQQDYEGNH